MISSNITRRIVMFRANNNGNGFIVDSSHNLEPVTNIMNSINTVLENKFKELEAMSSESIKSLLTLPDDYNFYKLSKATNELDHKGYIYYDPFILLYKVYTYTISHFGPDVCKYRNYTVSKFNDKFYITNKHGIVVRECSTDNIIECLDVIDIMCGDSVKHI